VEASSEQSAINKAKELCHGDEYEVEHHGNSNYSAEVITNDD
jgi:hypothetical protein